MYNLTEYGDIYLNTSEILSQYYRDGPFLNNAANYLNIKK